MDIQWKDRYNIDYKEIDSQHKKLLGIMNDLNSLIISSSTDSADEIRKILLRLVEYASIHFKYEEMHMARCDYYLKKDHIREHRKFIKYIIDFNDCILDKRELALRDMFEFLKNWYFDHIMQVDKLYEKSFKEYHMTAEKNAIIFDYGNVIESFDNDIFLEFLSERSPMNVDELRKKIYFQSTIVKDFETGKIPTEKFHEGICKLIDIQLDKEEFIKGFSGIFTINESVMDLILQLKPNYKLGLISNTNEIHFQNVIKRNEIFPLFDAVSLSFEVGVLKPEKKIFLDMIKKIGQIEEECVFIDDQPLYVKAAKGYCFKGVEFKSLELLVEDLKSLGVKGI